MPKEFPPLTDAVRSRIMAYIDKLQIEETAAESCDYIESAKSARETYLFLDAVLTQI